MVEKIIDFVVFSVSISCPVRPEKRLDQSAPASHARLGQVLLPFASVQLTVHAWGTFYWRHRGRMQRHFLGGTMSLLRLPTRRSAKAQRWRLVLIMTLQCILCLVNMITLLQMCYIKTMECKYAITFICIFISIGKQPKCGCIYRTTAVGLNNINHHTDVTVSKWQSGVKW